MKIGLVGFFGWGNFGDELFLEAHGKFLSDVGEVFPINDLQEKPYFTRPVESVVKGCDTLVIGGGDLVIPWTMSELYWKEEYLTKPVHIFGVGVPRWGGYDRAVVKRYRQFFQSESVKTIIARDIESADWITKHIKPLIDVQFFPDPVLALDLPAAEEYEEKILGISLRHRRAGPDDLTNVRELCERAKDLGYGVRHIVLGNMKTGVLDYEVARNFSTEDEEVVYSEDLIDICQSISECSAYASMKFHGTIVASMYGVPSIVISATDKSRNFSRMICRPDTISSLNDEFMADRLSYFPAPIHPMVIGHLKEQAREGYRVLTSSIIQDDG